MYRILEETVCKYLSVPAFKTKWENDQKQGAGFFYALTYPLIFRFFQEHKPLSEALELKVALVFSWNPTICKMTQDRFEQAKNKLAILERSVQQELNSKRISDIEPERVIHELWPPVKMATSRRDSNSGVSVTKFLHFTFPDIFPMIDLKTMSYLGGRTVDLNSYSEFLLTWKDLYGRSRVIFDQISNAMKMPVARVLDVMIFTPQ